MFRALHSLLNPCFKSFLFELQAEVMRVVYLEVHG